MPVGNGPVAMGAPLVLAVRPEKLLFTRHDPALPDADVNRLAAVETLLPLAVALPRMLEELEAELATAGPAEQRRLPIGH